MSYITKLIQCSYCDNNWYETRMSIGIRRLEICQECLQKEINKLDLVSGCSGVMPDFSFSVGSGIFLA